MFIGLLQVFDHEATAWDKLNLSDERWKLHRLTPAQRNVAAPSPLHQRCLLRPVDRHAVQKLGKALLAPEERLGAVVPVRAELARQGRVVQIRNVNEAVDGSRLLNGPLI